jgi:ADP-heptose:LPS heptosyltransferase
LARSFYTDIHDPGGGGLFDPGETRHVVLMNLGLLQPLGVSAEGAPEFPIGPVSSSVARAMSERSGGHYTLLNPGAAWPNKRWPASRLGEVAFALRERYGLMSVVVWGTGERPLAEELALHSGGAAIVSPPTSVADLVALARGAALVVSADTGPLHVAAAVGAPVVGIFGPTRPARNGPWSPRDVCVSRADACRCHHARRCRLGTPCLEDIQVDEVLAAIAERLNGANQAISGPPRDSREPLRSAEALSTSGGAS